MKNENNTEEAYMQRSVMVALRIGFVALLFGLSYWILKPFISPVVWGIIIAVGIYPIHMRFARLLGNRAKLSAVLISLIGISIIVVPSILFTSSTVKTVSEIVTSIEDETLEVQPPDASVKDWPLIGEKIFAFWSSAARDLTTTLKKYEPQLREMAPKLTSAIGKMVGSILLFIISMIIASSLLLLAEPGKKIAHRIFGTLAGEKDEELTILSIATIRSVVQGVIGIAVIQTFFLSIGMFVVDLPAAGIITIIVLIVCIIQLPPLLVMIPIIIYVFSVTDTVTAVIFAAWSILWSLADMFLKPMLLGKGVDVPMLVILLGAIGGMMLGGPVGLFVGSVVLALAYKIFIAMLIEP